MAITYKDAGVDIDAQDRLVGRIKGLARAATRPEVIGGIGGFSGLCRIPAGYERPVLVAGSDGVGTKLKTAFALDCHDTVGIDLVAMCANDVAACGAEPVFFLDYFATGKLAPDAAEKVIAGIAAGCREAGCALLGGETAELPGMYPEGEYDLAGFCVGVIEESAIRDGRDLVAGDVLLGLPSVGLHANGHALARKALLEVLALEVSATHPLLGDDTTVGQELLRPTRIYVPALAALAGAGIRFKAASHITGGGLIDNPPRMLAGAALTVGLRPETWPEPGIFALLRKAGIAEDEMRRTFNLGLGMLLCVAAADASAAVSALTSAGHQAHVVGQLLPRDGDRPVTFA
ncbi:MAG TPA: phosphoribosylformylglycinamidine cyclo-ligase [Kofleriaceae bacterium]|nr:phosphoribosylformylglycinamidine cyclo-ligase [Kofleriaceae bacterium]